MSDAISTWTDLAIAVVGNILAFLLGRSKRKKG